MADEIKPGSMLEFSNSMAAEIEDELDALMTADGLPSIKDAAAENRRDRQRLFVAIARGVVKHLQDQKGAIKVFCEDNETKPVTEIVVDFD